MITVPGLVPLGGMVCLTGAVAVTSPRKRLDDCRVAGWVSCRQANSLACDRVGSSGWRLNLDRAGVCASRLDCDTDSCRSCHCAILAFNDCNISASALRLKSDGFNNLVVNGRKWNIDDDRTTLCNTSFDSLVVKRRPLLIAVGLENSNIARRTVWVYCDVIQAASIAIDYRRLDNNGTRTNTGRRYDDGDRCRYG